MEFYRLVVLRELELEGDSVRLLCFRVWFFWDNRRTSQIDVLGSEFEIAAPFLEEDVRKEKFQRGLSQLSLKARFSIISTADFFGAVAYLSSFFLGDDEFHPRVFGDRRRINWVGDWSSVEGTSRGCYQTPGTANSGPSVLFGRVSAVRVEDGSCWSMILVMVISVFIRRT